MWRCMIWYVIAFRSNLMPLFYLENGRKFSPKHWYIYTNLHGLIFRKTSIFTATDARTLYLSQFQHFAPVKFMVLKIPVHFVTQLKRTLWCVNHMIQAFAVMGTGSLTQQWAQAGAPGAKCRLDHVHRLGVLTFKNLLNQTIKLYRDNRKFHTVQSIHQSTYALISHIQKQL